MVPPRPCLICRGPIPEWPKSSSYGEFLRKTRKLSDLMRCQTEASVYRSLKCHRGYFFTAPLYSLYIEPSDLPDFIVFMLFAFVIGWFSSRRRRIEQALRQARDELATEAAARTRQASLLDLTHDTIFVRDMSDVITYWNRGAQELYGWTAEEAIGKRTHQLLQTVFPVPMDEIRAELLRAGRWEGELEKTKADGTQVVVASRWSLRRDEQERPVAVLETNNDITERKRTEGEIRTLNGSVLKVRC
jgi:PAS domain S-box-containing protein